MGIYEMNDNVSTLTEEQKTKILEALALSEEHSINPAGRQGFGQLMNGVVEQVRCTARLSELATNGSVPDGVTPVFAIVEHPEHGHIAVAPEEFAALGLPEVAGWDWMGR